jgi:transposase-like protein
MRSPRKKRHTRRDPAEIARLIDAYHGSGLTQRAFARRHGISPATLSHWVRKGKPANGKHSRSAGPVLVPVELVDAPAPVAEAFEIVLRNDRRVRVASVFDERALRKLLAVVED